MRSFSIFSLADRTALIAGASRGIGLAIARAAAEAGARTILAARTIDSLEKNAAALRHRGLNAEATSLDVTDSGSISTLVRTHPEIDILINVAGTNFRKRFETYTKQEYDVLLQTNLHGIVELTQQVGSGMISRGKGGKIIKVVPVFITNAIDDIPLPLYGDGRQMRDYQYVLDHCEGIDVVLHRGQVGEIYNVGSEAETENMVMAHAILDLLGKPYSLIQPITDRPGHDRRYSLNCAKLRALGWRSQHTFEQAIEETVRWYAENEWWWRKIKSGEYKEYYQRQYAGREVK